MDDKKNTDVDSKSLSVVSDKNIDGVDKKIKLEELKSEIEKDGKKLIPLSGFNDDLRTRVLFSFNELANLKAETKEKLEKINNISVQLNEKVDALIHSKVVSVDQGAKKAVENDVKKYSLILKRVVSELEMELKSLGTYLGKELPTMIVAFKDEPDDFVAYLKNRLKGTRRYIKTVRKNLNVSFSRFQMDLNYQLQRLHGLQHYSKVMETVKKMDSKKVAEKNESSDSKGNSSKS